MQLKSSFLFLFLILAFASFAQDGILSRPNSAAPGIAYRYAISDSGFQGKAICGKPPQPPSYIRNDSAMIVRFDRCNMVFWTWFNGAWDSTILRRSSSGSGGNAYTNGSGLNLSGFQFSVDATVERKPGTTQTNATPHRLADNSTQDRLNTMQELYDNLATQMAGNGSIGDYKPDYSRYSDSGNANLYGYYGKGSLIVSSAGGKTGLFDTTRLRVPRTDSTTAQGFADKQVGDIIIDATTGKIRQYDGVHFVYPFVTGTVSGFTAGGDLTGTSTSQTVNQINWHYKELLRSHFFYTNTVKRKGT